MDKARMDRREFLRAAGMAGIALAGAACAPAAAPPSATPTKAPAAATPAPAAPAATPASVAAATPAALTPAQVRAQLYEAAKKEGQVMIYSSGTSAEMDLYRKAFTKSYPGIEVQEYLGTTEQIIEKMLTEYKAGRVNADFVRVSLETWARVGQEGLAEKWDPPEKVNYLASAVDPNGYFVLSDSVIHVMSYNTQLVPANAVPKSYQDLLNPIFKGKLGLEQAAYSWFAQRMQIWGTDKAVEYARKLAQQQPKFVSGHTALVDAVLSGEIWAAVNVYQNRVVGQQAKGAPVKWVADEPTGAEPSGSGLVKGAPHPNAGKLFLDWRLSPEGLEVSTKGVGYYPTAKNASYPPELQVKVVFPTVATSKLAQDNTKLFKEIFGLL
ncbi:MAG: extracellular solute-binding protein [Dehalococcoidia bacterium]|nr:extracellular solute-binding protein [Dehalococcoidia bacterium]